MARLDHKGALIANFQPVGSDADLSNALRRVQILLGQISGSVEGLILTSSAASMLRQSNAEKANERRAKRETSDALFVELLRLGELDTYVAETFVAAMNTARLHETIDLIEDETGQAFEDYALAILQADMPDRQPNETEDDYHRRVLTAVTDAILNDDLSIKPGYEHDPLARIIRADALYQDAQAAVAPQTPEAKASALDERVDNSTAATADNAAAFASLKM